MSNKNIIAVTIMAICAFSLSAFRGPPDHEKISFNAIRSLFVPAYINAPNLPLPKGRLCGEIHSS